MENFLQSLFPKNEKTDEELRQEVLDRRQETKDKLAKNLKEKLFFNDEDMEEIFEIVDDALETIDSILNNTDYENYKYNSSVDLEEKLSKIKDKMREDVIDKVKEIVDAKLKRARKIFHKD